MHFESLWSLRTFRSLGCLCLRSWEGDDNRLCKQMQKPSDKIQDDFTGYILYTTFCQDILFYILLMQTLSISILGSFKIMT